MPIKVYQCINPETGCIYEFEEIGYRYAKRMLAKLRRRSPEDKAYRFMTVAERAYWNNVRNANREAE